MKTLKLFILVCSFALMAQNLRADSYAPCDSVPGNVVVNCGFESSNFIPWIPGGNITHTQVAEDVFNGYVANSGTYYVVMGPVGSEGTLSQTLTTVAGENYTFAFYFASEGDDPSDFSAYCDGTQLLSLTNPDSGQAYNLYMYTVAATGTDTIEFSFRDDPGWMALDDVSVSNVPEPGTLGLLFLGLGLAFGVRRLFA